MCGPPRESHRPSLALGDQRCPRRHGDPAPARPRSTGPVPPGRPCPPPQGVGAPRSTVPSERQCRASRRLAGRLPTPIPADPRRKRAPSTRGLTSSPAGRAQGCRSAVSASLPRRRLPEGPPRSRDPGIRAAPDRKYRRASERSRRRRYLSLAHHEYRRSRCEPAVGRLRRRVPRRLRRRRGRPAIACRPPS